MDGLLCAGQGAAWGPGLGAPRDASGHRDHQGTCRGVGPPEPPGAAVVWDGAHQRRRVALCIQAGTVGLFE